MATTLDIAPSVGHPVLMTQAGVGASPGYDAIDVRRAIEANYREGVQDANSWKVSEHTPNSLSVDIAANGSPATVQGDSVANQSRYVVAPHSAVATLTLATADPSNPRLDQIVLRVYDNTHDGLGQNKASLEIVKGTATPAATLDNRSGAASLPANALRLADILLAAGDTTITNNDIRDRRPLVDGLLLSASPTSLVDGQTFYYVADPTNGVTWQFRYRTASASAYKWEYVGGSHLHSGVATSEATSGTGWQDVTTVGPQITVPLAGDYDVSIGCLCVALSAVTLKMTFDVGVDTSGRDDDDIEWYGPGRVSIGRTRRKLALAAGTTLTAKYRTPDGAAATSFMNRFMRVLPVRIQ